MLATCAIVRDPSRKIGGASGSNPACSPRKSRVIADAPPPCASGSRATSTYAAPASSSTRRTYSPRPGRPGQ